MKCVAFALLLVVPAVLGNRLPFRATLYDMNGEFYELMWGFSVEDKTIDFTVNVSTTGWVGFGLSPNGDMRNSDVVIGWVDDSGQAFFHDRYADERALPPVDDQQDWVLTEGQEADGFTTLSFTRPWVTCDERDRDIVAQTARVVFSWNEADPVNNDEDGVMYHGASRSSASLNLLGGNPDPPPEPEDSGSFFIGVDNVVIPPDSTTYWCTAIRIPDAVTSGAHYIYKYSPEIQPENTAFVHHIIVYQCGSLVNVTEGTSGPCSGEIAVEPITECRSGFSIAGWAVGGGDFLYPEGVGQQISGRESDGQFAVIELHYDNPQNVRNVVDNSGIRIFYTANVPENVAGILTIGAPVSQHVIIPPNAPNFTVTAHCPISCTEMFLPEEGITVFANNFHTHLAGHGLVLEHYRTTSCPTSDVLEEMPPVERNLFYDFNYQQINSLPNELKIFPGDRLVLKCFYDTTADRRTEVTLGGEGTRDEMCFAFVQYYPARNNTLALCTSVTAEHNYDAFIDNYVPNNLQNDFTEFRNTINSQDQRVQPSSEEVKALFNRLEWTAEQVEGLEQSLVYSEQAFAYDLCFTRGGGFHFDINAPLPATPCTYQEPNACTNFTAVPCCERLGAPGLTMSFTLILSMLLLMVAMF